MDVLIIHFDPISLVEDSGFKGFNLNRALHRLWWSRLRMPMRFWKICTWELLYRSLRAIRLLIYIEKYCSGSCVRPNSPLISAAMCKVITQYSYGVLRASHRIPSWYEWESLEPRGSCRALLGGFAHLLHMECSNFSPYTWIWPFESYYSLYKLSVVWSNLIRSVASKRSHFRFAILGSRIWHCRNSEQIILWQNYGTFDIFESKSELP